jgi:hypothetical protein
MPNLVSQNRRPRVPLRHAALLDGVAPVEGAYTSSDKVVVAAPGAWWWCLSASLRLACCGGEVEREAVRWVLGAASPGRPWWRVGRVVLRIFYHGAQVESVFAGILAPRCGFASSFFWAPWWCDFEGGGRDKLPSLEDIRKELSSGGLSATCFRHPAGPNGYREAAPPLHRLRVDILCI